jgi:hypothetical protein
MAHRTLRAGAGSAYRRWVRAWVAVVLLLASSGCIGYRSALGFRARRAVLEDDAARFEDLMEEAADTTPAGPLDNPKLTVLTHFLDLAGDPLFFPYIEDWMAKGWVSDTMTCAIHRARFRSMRDKDPAEADRAAQVCIKRARHAATDPELQWEVDRCLEEAPFLVDTSTTALVPYLRMVAEPTEPVKFRYGLLDGMTRVYISSPSRIASNDSSLTREEAAEIARGHVDKQVQRLDFIIAAVRPYVNATLLASSTARGVLEVENVSVALGKSYIGKFATSDDPYERDVAWAWVRTQKNRKKVNRIAALGLYNRAKETRKDVYWYFCSRRGGDEAAKSGAGVLGPLNMIEAISIRRKEAVDDVEALRAEVCADYPTIGGPYPLEATGRGTVTASVAEALGEEKIRTSVLLRKRVLD